MKRFRWRLQRVLDVKVKEERVKRAALLAVTERLAQRREELLIQRITLKKIMSELGKCKPAERISEQEFILKHSQADDKRVRELEEKVRHLEKERKEKVNSLLEVKRLKEGLEKLREQAKRRFMHEQEKFEQKQIDEGATMRFARNLS